MEDRYAAHATDWLGEPTVLLRDAHAGAEALVAPGCGANCVSFVITHAGQRLAILETPPTPEDLRTRRFRGGIPVLFPFPGRLRDARYSFGGQAYQLPRSDRSGVHHIHGVVNGSAWRVVNQGSSEQGAFVACAIGTGDLSAEMRAGYPFPFEATLTFSLMGNRLTLLFVVENRGAAALPFDYGLHPYFRAPLAELPEGHGVPPRLPGADERAALPVLIPAAARWPLAEGLPTGAPQPLEADDDFRNWRPLGGAHRDQIFGQVEQHNGWSSAGYRDPATGLEVRVHADATFHEWVLFTQPNRPSLCIEPYTGMPNAINMAAEGVPGPGALVLEPGATWRGEVVIEVLSAEC